MAMTFKDSGDVVLLQGAIDEFVDYIPLQTRSGPLKLNLAGVTAINSHGMRAWINFLGSRRGAEIALYGCPPVFLDAVNLVPQVASADGSLQAIKSASMPYTCAHCARVSFYELLLRDLPVTAAGVGLPIKPCRTCSAKLEADVEAQDMLLFMTG